jgi:hypothetical protein
MRAGVGYSDSIDSTQLARSSVTKFGKHAGQQVVQLA